MKPEMKGRMYFCLKCNTTVTRMHDKQHPLLNVNMFYAHAKYIGDRWVSGAKRCGWIESKFAEQCK